MKTLLPQSVSVVCPVFNEAGYIATCVESMLMQDMEWTGQELIFVDGGSTDGTRAKLDEFARAHSFIRVLENPRHITPCAMNIGIRASKGDTLIRIDAHTRYPRNYISALLAHLEESGADNVGGLCRTLPAKDSVICRSIALCTSHRFGVGPALFRTGVSAPREVDTVPFGCYRRKVFEKIGLFDEALLRAQDYELNARLRASGGKIMLFPDIVVEYFARDSLRKLGKTYWQNGLFKPLTAKNLKQPTSVRQLFPALFVAGLIAGGLASVFVPWLWVAYAAVLAIYVLTGLAIGVKAAKRERAMGMAICVPWTFVVLHVCYGAGYWVGLWKMIGAGEYHASFNR